MAMCFYDVVILSNFNIHGIHREDEQYDYIRAMGYDKASIQRWI